MRGRPPAGRADGSAALASRELKTLRERDVRLLLPDGPDAVGGGRAHYDAFRSTTGTLMLVPHLGARTAPATVVRRLRGWRRAPDEDVTVAGREPLVPALVAAAGVGRRVREVLFEPDPRRRAAFVLERANGPVVLKATRNPLETSRGHVEQERLAALASRGITRVPRALGHGTFGDVGWSAESFVPGRPMSSASRWWRRRHGRTVLEQLASWLDDLASSTTRARAGAIADEQLPLAGPAREPVLRVLDGLADTVAVTLHGDLASGANVLVDGRAFAVIDWETSIDDGLPLVDLLPTLALGLARLHEGGAPAPELAARVVALCRGRTEQSAWLFDRVGAHLSRLGVERALAGPLAVAAWGYQASMRERHDALVRASGATPVPWTSPAEVVFDAWMGDGDLGAEWPAFTKGRA